MNYVCAPKKIHMLWSTVGRNSGVDLSIICGANNDRMDGLHSLRFVKYRRSHRARRSRTKSIAVCYSFCCCCWLLGVLGQCDAWWVLSWNVLGLVEDYVPIFQLIVSGGFLCIFILRRLRHGERQRD